MTIPIALPRPFSSESCAAIAVQIGWGMAEVKPINKAT